VSPVGWCLHIVSWCSTKGIGVSCRLVPANIAVVGWCLHEVLSWCSAKGIGVSCRLVPANIVTVGWCLHDFIKYFFCGFLPFGFHVKSLCIVDCMVVYLSLS
jgi:hypothetical protein